MESEYLGSYNTYPENLPHQFGNEFTLEDYRLRLERTDRHRTQTYVTIQDMHPNGVNIIAETIPELEGSLNEKARSRLRDLQVGNQFEIICLCPQSRRGPLDVTSEMLKLILTFYMVMPEYLGFIMCLNSAFNPSPSKYSTFNGFSTKFLAQEAVQSDWRSKQGLQLCYTLKRIREDVRPHPELENYWAFRQAVVHHQFDLETGDVLFIVTEDRGDLPSYLHKKSKMWLRTRNGMYNDRFEEQLSASLTIHIMLCSLAVAGWPWYLNWLEEELDKQYLGFLEPPNNKPRPPRELQELWLLEQKVNEALFVLESNLDIMESLRRLYRDRMPSLLTEFRQDFRLKQSEFDPHLRDFEIQISEIIDNMRRYMKRSHYLLTSIPTMKAVIVEQQREQHQHRSLSLAEKNTELSIDSLKMRYLSQNYMRGFAFVFLLLLPGIFVSTLFSTDIIQFENSRTVFSSRVLNLWLAVALPLTAVGVFVISFTWYIPTLVARTRWRRSRAAARS